MSYFTATGTTLIARRGYGGSVPTGLGGILDKVGDFLKGGATTAIDVFKSSQQNAGAAAAYQQVAMQQAAQQRGTPGWVMPVAIGGAAVALGAVLLSRGKRKNPARGRRRRRRR
jgi:hypothetical protein